MGARDDLDGALRAVLDAVVALHLAQQREVGEDRAVITVAEAAALDLAAKMVGANVANLCTSELLHSAVDDVQFAGMKSPRFTAGAEKLCAFITDLAAATDAEVQNDAPHRARGAA